ncbi:hypothetical protein D3C85_1467280 [compost metagenome]
MVNNSKSLTDINKPKTIEEIMTMGLEILAGSVADLDDWGSDAKSESSSSEDGKDLGITDDDWDTL